MIKASFQSDFSLLVDNKNMSIEEKRRIIATSAALDLITLAIQQEGSTHTLVEEMANLPNYVDTICRALAATAG